MMSLLLFDIKRLDVLSTNLINFFFIQIHEVDKISTFFDDAARGVAAAMRDCRFEKNIPVIKRKRWETGESS